MPSKRKKRNSQNLKSKSQVNRKINKNDGNENVNAVLYNNIFPLLLPVPKVETIETSGECLLQAFDNNDEESICNTMQACASNSTNQTNLNTIFSPRNLEKNINPSQFLMPLKLANENYDLTKIKTINYDVNNSTNMTFRMLNKKSENRSIYNLPKIDKSNSYMKNTNFNLSNVNGFMNNSDDSDEPFSNEDLLGSLSNKLEHENSSDELLSTTSSDIPFL